MDFKTIELSDRNTIEKIRKEYNHLLSSHAFCSLYLWQDVLKLCIACEDDFFAVRCEFKGENCFFFPCGSEKKKKEFIRKHLREKKFKLCYMSEADVDFLSRHFDGCFDITYDRNSCEYIYDKTELLSMSGGKFAKIRTKLHHLEREHSLRVEVLTRENSSNAKEIIDVWAENYEGHDSHPFDDIDVTIRAIDQADKLGLEGVITYVDGQPYAVTAGCGISETVFDLCVAKQKSAIPGLDYYAKINLYKIIPDRFTYINAEEDVGIEGLRIHKRDMRPIKLADIWEGTTKMYEEG